ncbi:MAG: DeoR/GlpR transcriptional regulator, partial [Clostridia bacterium]|nr:DeoR/GlpR transcriptional regulator [Clostridia bacterium]
MSRQPIFTEERRNRILQVLKEQNKVLVTELCKIFSVSQATIRTDLNALEKQGLLQRTHGGAIIHVGASFERTSRQKEQLHADEKMRIAKAAAELV